MSEEKRYDPTPKRREDFRKKGEFVRSRDMSAFAVTTAAAAALALSGAVTVRSLLNMMRISMDFAPGDASAPSLGFFLGSAGEAIMGPLTAAFAVAVAVGFAQNKGRPNFAGIRFDPKRLNPLPKLKQMLASSEAIVGLLMSMLKVTFVAGICGMTLWQHLPVLLSGSLQSWSAIWEATAPLVGSLLWRAAMVVGALAVADLAVNWIKLERRMRMTSKEMRDEMKEDQGDPMIRAQRRRRARELVQQRSVKDVPTADVIVVNPTHFAVALRYESGSMDAPRVVAKGADARAALIRRIARQSGVAIVSNPPLTRALYKAVKVGHQIPADLYSAVAILIAHVYRNRRDYA